MRFSRVKKRKVFYLKHYNLSLPELHDKYTKEILSSFLSFLTKKLLLSFYIYKFAHR